MADNAQITTLKAQVKEAREEYRRKEREASDAEERLLQLKDQLEAMGVSSDPDEDEE